MGTGAINHALYRTMPYRPEDLTAVPNICTVPNVIMVANRVPALTGLGCESNQIPGLVERRRLSAEPM